MTTHFHGCTALITGASAGLGTEFARQLAPDAKCLILIGRRADRLDALKTELARPGFRIECHAIDLTDHAQLESFATDITLNTENVDLLVNNAGLGDHGLFEASDWRRVEAMLEVNIRALTRLTHALLPQLVRSGHGTILNVSSIAGLLPVPKMAVYAATKAYVSSFTEALRAELRGTGVNVTALCPGPIDTEFFHRAERPGAHSGVPTPEFFKIPASQSVREALSAAARNRPRVISGLTVWIAMTIVTLLPIALVRLFLPGRKRFRSVSRNRGL